MSCPVATSVVGSLACNRAEEPAVRQAMKAFANFGMMRNCATFYFAWGCFRYFWPAGHILPSTEADRALAGHRAEPPRTENGRLPGPEEKGLTDSANVRLLTGLRRARPGPHLDIAAKLRLSSMA